MELKRYESKFFILVFIFLAIFPIVSLFHGGLPWTHDGLDHVARIANFYQNLTEGTLVPRWTANVNNGFGSPILEFIYPLPYYLASFFHFLRFSLIDSTKIVYGLGMVSSLAFMYLWLSKFTSRYAALFGAVLYTYAPYRFVDLSIRGDIGENLAFAFIPLTLFFVYQTANSKSVIPIILGSISLSLLITSHNAISIMAIPFIIFYSLFLTYLSKTRKLSILKFLALIFVGFCLSAFFWIPGLIEGKYTLRNILTQGIYVNNFLALQELIYTPWRYGFGKEFTFQLGIFQWLALIFSPVLLCKLFKKKDKNYILVLGLIGYALIAIFLMFPVSSFIWSKIMLLQNFQFPWRFLAVAVFATSVLAALIINEFKIKRQLVLVSILIVLILIISSPYRFPHAYKYLSDKDFTGIINRTTDSGESTPIWSVKSMGYIPKANLEILDGDATIRNIERTSTYHLYAVHVEKPTLFAENTLYFPGWQIRANGKIVNVEFQNINYRGIMTFRLDPGDYEVVASYGETKLRAISNLISLVSVVAILIFAGFRFVKR